MGNRGSIYLVETEGRGRRKSGTYFYTHREGCDLPAVVKQALIAAGESRSDLTTLIRLVAGGIIQSSTKHAVGLLVSGDRYQTDHPLVVVNLPSSKVAFAVDDGYQLKNRQEWTFDEYLAADELSLDRIYHLGGSPKERDRKSTPLPRILWPKDPFSHAELDQVQGRFDNMRELHRPECDYGWDPDERH